LRRAPPFRESMRNLRLATVLHRQDRQGQR